MQASTRAERLHLRCFIEGEEVPVIAANVMQSVQAAATAYIQIIGTEEALQLRPRSIVELYYRHNGPRRRLSDVQALPIYEYDITGNVQQLLKPVNFNAGATAVLNGLFNQSIGVDEAEDDLQYDLLFAGELTGYTFYEDTQTRTINLLCSDFSNHLDHINQFTFDVANSLAMGGLARMSLLAGFNDSGLSLASYSEEGFDKFIPGNELKIFDINKATGALGSAKQFDLNVISSGTIGLDQRMARIFGDLGLEGGLKFIFESVAGSYVYYKDIDEELNLRDQIFLANDRHTAGIYKQSALVEYIFGVKNRYGMMNSLRNLLKILFKLTHFEFVPVASSAFYTATPYKYSEDGAKPNLASGKVALRQTLIKPELFLADPPACNVVFPDEIYSVNVTRHFLSEPTRGVESTDHVAASEQLGTNVGQVSTQFTLTPSPIVDENGKLFTYAPQQMTELINSLDRKGTLQSLAQTLLPEEVLKGILPLISFTPHMLRSAYLGKLRPSQELVSGGKGEFDLDNPTGDFKAFDEEDKRFFIREANYKFFMAKYENRTAEANCKFLPRMVPGFTALVSEKSPFKVLKRNEKYFGYIGYVLSMTHSVSQAGGVTTLSMSHVRPTTEEVDLFDSTVKGNVRSIIPDLRVVGTVPWGDEDYGPKNVHIKYKEWLGGLDWRGVDALAAVDQNPGMLPLPDAVKRVFKADMVREYGPALLTDSRTMPSIKVLMGAYHRFRDEAGPSGTRTTPIEEFINSVTVRPVANRLQMRGWLNAYLSNEKSKTRAAAAGTEIWAARQRALHALGYYTGDITGVPDGATREAILAVKQRLFEVQGDVVVDQNWDDNVENMVSSSLLMRMPAEAMRLITGMDPRRQKVMDNRIIRRNLRLEKVLLYKESLQSPGGGLRG